MSATATGGRLLPTQVARGGSSPGALLPVAAAVALALACVPIGVLFADRQWVGPAVVTIAVVCGVGGLLRALPVPLLLVPLAQSASFAAVMAWLFGSGTGAGPWQALLAYRDLVADGVAAVRTSVAPVAGSPEFLALVALLVFLAALLLETLAVGMGLAGGSGLVLLVMAAAPLGIRPTGSALLLLAGPALGWALLMAADYAIRLRRPVASGSSTGTVLGRSAAGAAGLAAVAAAGAALLVGAVVPSGTEVPWLRSWWNDTARPGAQVAALDPFVSVESQLRSQSPAQILRYRSSDGTATYLGMITLEIFDGTSWVPYPPAPGDPLSAPRPGLGPPTGTGPTYDVEIAALGNEYLPLPEQATAVEVADGTERWTWDARTGDAFSTVATASGSSYRVTTSTAPASADAFGTGSAGGPAPTRQTRSLPGALYEPLVDLAGQLTAGAASNYERAVALQQWFTAGGGFTYSLDVPDPAGRPPLLAFLEDRTGFCQQFATGMAALARSLGIPARVVVGFAGGVAQPDGSFAVTGADAHAWPELWFDAVGWVRFEPTPASGSAAVDAPAYTPEQPEPSQPPAPAPSAPPAAEPTAPPADAVPGAGTDPGTGSAFPTRLLVLVALTAAAATLLALGPLVRSHRRRDRLRRCDSGDAGAAWEELCDAARDAGLPWPERGTPRQQAAVVAAGLGLDRASDEAAALRRLVAGLESQRFAPAVGTVGGGRASVIVLDEPVGAASPAATLRSDVSAVTGRLDALPRSLARRILPRSLYRSR